MKHDIFVTGHRSPDTDSICSSLAMAKLKQLQGFDAVAVRAGEPNKESLFALQYFHVELQPLVTDFYVKVGDAVYTDMAALPVSASLKDAANWFRGHAADILPVSDGGKFVGVVDRAALAEEFIKTVRGEELSTIKALAHDPALSFAVGDNGHDVPAEGTYPVTDDGKYVGLVCAEAVAKVKKQKVFLVDHNEKKQIIDGIDEAEIIGVLDHHRIGGTLATAGPIFILFKPVGCSATIVTEQYEAAHIAIPKDIAGLLLSAIISDTVLFRSPTCTEEDKQAACKLAEIAGVDIETYGMEMLKAGANVSDLTPDQIAHNDMKEFNGNGKTFTVSQVQVMDTTDLLAQKKVLLSALEKMRAEKNYVASFLMITSIIDESTNLIFAGNMDDIVAKAFAADVLDKEVFLPQVMSRKKQVIPPILSAM
ncbi:manganese-dependent inorganic pyrophosphatase [Megasphaera vaginalis (ex Srinivasan et al. 2021)]|uniref:inorganic diphosphatase n=1 Tax=Megasphaera vaginalis (ex Srinivasan et al. 2021) TaxID=1111454 RepID=U7UR26_9FIRM|nr:manganese-dependent inorganic pyrophosphatase [Megasphaera vaginalis (ex Srinivasan et al. 2021)]ERT61731.1 putative inorganic pyrophosphatase PpaC [Megasphaera vaginalis (ex Srinivasan et al. 2021)]